MCIYFSDTVGTFNKWAPFFVYQYAKQRMLQFYFEFLVQVIHISNFQMSEMDTAWAYLALSNDSPQSVIKEDMREEVHLEKAKWFPGKDSLVNVAYDKRTPGLFKVELEGQGIVSLCSKTYFCFGDQNKVSWKGLNKNAISVVY